MRFSRSLAQTVVLLLLTLSAPMCMALATDHEQEINIEADSAEFREPEGVTVWEGNVSMTQGSITVQADRITVHTQNGMTTRLVVEGNPAHYMQTINEGGDRVIATSNHMEYLTVEGILTLTEDARLTQQGTTLSGNQIVYDVQQHVLRASSQGDSNQERVRVTIPPTNLRVPEVEPTP